MACHCSVGLNWLWTPHWCALSMRTGQPAEEPLTLMEWLSQLLDEGRRRPTRSWWGVEVERALWFSPWRWGAGGSPETQSFLSQLASAKARAESPLMRAWRFRWGALLSCSAARAVAMSLLEWQGTRGADGTCPPSHEVERACFWFGSVSRAVLAGAFLCPLDGLHFVFEISFQQRVSQKKEISESKSTRGAFGSSPQDRKVAGCNQRVGRC